MHVFTGWRSQNEPNSNFSEIQAESCSRLVAKVREPNKLHHLTLGDFPVDVEFAEDKLTFVLFVDGQLMLRGSFLVFRQTTGLLSLET